MTYQQGTARPHAEGREVSVKRYSVKGSWCTDTEITWSECEMVEAAAYDAEVARRRGLLAALRELIRCEDEAVYHSVSHHEAIAAARKALAAAGGQP